MWSKTSLEEGPISQKLQKFKHHDFIFKVSTPPRHKLLHMGILAQILENLTNFYFDSDFANCTNFMWSKTSLEEGPISQKLQKFKHHDFIFKVSTPRINSYRHNVVKNIFRRGSHFTKIARKCTFYFSQALIPRPFYTAHLVLLRIWRVGHFVTLTNWSLII